MVPDCGHQVCSDLAGTFAHGLVSKPTHKFTDRLIGPAISERLLIMLGSTKAATCWPANLVLYRLIYTIQQVCKFAYQRLELNMRFDHADATLLHTLSAWQQNPPG